LTSGVIIVFQESGGGYENAFQLGGSFNKLYKKNWLGADVGVHFRRPSEGIDTAYATVLTSHPILTPFC
jgi:hypothetical protein